jgi:hypothetical protein
LTWSSNDPGHLQTTNLSKPFTLQGGIVPGVSVTGQGSVSLDLTPLAAIYGIGGPDVSFDAELDASLNFDPSPGQPFLEIQPKLVAKAGLEFDVLGFSGQADATIVSINFPAFTIDKPPTAAYTLSGPSEVPVGSSGAYTATRPDGQSDPVTWSLRGGVSGDSISNGVFTPAEPGGRIVTLYAEDSSGAAGSTSVTVGKPFDSPGDVAATEHTTDVGMDIDWSAPSNTGDTGLADYIVTTDPSTGNHVVSAGTASPTLDNLSPGEYSIDVYAQNTGGELSAPGETQIYLTPLCTDTFTGTDSNEWNGPNNWSEGHVPGDSEWACTTAIPSTSQATTTQLSRDFRPWVAASLSRERSKSTSTSAALAST